jgi:dolichol-phosphate mannosyltransferase
MSSVDCVDGVDGVEPMLTLVVPTRNEVANVVEFVRRVERAVGKRAEIVFVDDSDDDTPAVIREARLASTIPIHLIHRSEEQRANGLSGAVVEGLRISRARHACTIDADLQHPPELLPHLLRRAVDEDLDLVVASRRCGGGSMDSLGPIRRVASELSTLAARALFPRLLMKVTDPMSGFFLLRCGSVDLERLRPRGFKILLELLLRNPDLRVAEVPFEFGERHGGESKASLREGITYLQQLAALRLGGRGFWRQLENPHVTRSRHWASSRSN